LASALDNLLKATELRKRLLFTLAMFIVFRAGTQIPVPGVNAAMIERLFNSGNLFGLLDLFSGGALSKFSIFAMSITPYINASIITQLLTVVIPTLEEWSKEGAEGAKKNQQNQPLCSGRPGCHSGNRDGLWPESSSQQS
jgi:preprotein translocase subunit SecY